MTAWLRDRRPVALAILMYVGWNAHALLDTWRHAPYDRLGGLAFLLWAAPLLSPRLRGPSPRPGWLAAAALVSLAGQAGELGVATHLGLGLALFAFVRPGPAGWIWLAGAAAWMPAAGYALRTLGPGPVLAVRLALAAGASALAFAFARRPPSGESRHE